VNVRAPNWRPEIKKNSTVGGRSCFVGERGKTTRKRENQSRWPGRLVEKEKKQRKNNHLTASGSKVGGAEGLGSGARLRGGGKLGGRRGRFVGQSRDP